MITDEDNALAYALCERLNRLIEDENVRAFVLALIEDRVQVPMDLITHPSIQVDITEGEQTVVRAGLLGLLNGIIGEDHGRGILAYYALGNPTQIRFVVNEAKRLPRVLTFRDIWRAFLDRIR